jgi:hypothetical protein
MPPLTYHAIVKKPERFLALTSLLPEEFNELLEETENVFQIRMKTLNINGRERNSRKYTEYKNSAFNTKEERLLLAMVYLKNNLTQEMLATLFNVTQPKINVWLNVMLLCVKQALINLNYAPARNNETLQKLLAQTDSPLFHKMRQKDANQDLPINKLKKNTIVVKRNYTPRKTILL